MPRAPVDHIPAPAFPRALKWINVATLRMDQQRGRPVLVEFWDFCRPNSIRTLPYMRAWHERYADAGLRVIGVHSPGFEPSVDPDAVAAAVSRLGIEYPVGVDSEHAVWEEYENLGWPARYLFNQQGRLHSYHFGEGGYAETEHDIQELLGVERDLVEPVRPEDAPDASLVAQSEDVLGPYSGPYEAGGVWGVFAAAGEDAATGEGPPAINGEVTANGTTIAIDHPGAYQLISHDGVHTEGVLDLRVGPGVACLAVCFTPGLAR